MMNKVFCKDCYFLKIYVHNYPPRLKNIYICLKESKDIPLNPIYGFVSDEIWIHNGEHKIFCKHKNKNGECGDFLPKKELTLYKQKNDDQYRCNCSCAEPCILGKIGMEYRCSEEELKFYYVDYIKHNYFINLLRETISWIKNLLQQIKF